MKIGRVVRTFCDQNRNEIFNCANEKRTLIISIFYPADNEFNVSRNPLYKDLYEPHEKRFVDSWAESDDEIEFINNLATNIHQNAPIINNREQYPVLIYSPGFSCDRDSTVFIIEKLIEEGYVVITIGAIYETDFTVMPDGQVVEMLKTLENLSPNAKEVWKELIDYRKADIRFLIDQLDNINRNDDLFKGKLDTKKVGAIGFSLGAQAVFEAAADDKRIKAVVLLEGCLHNSTVLDKVDNNERSNTPHLLIKRHASSHKLRMEECQNWYANLADREKAERLTKEQIEIACIISQTQKALYEFIDGYKSFIRLDHSKHMTFCDMPMLLNQEYEECFGGRISIRRAYEAINKATAKFLNEFLKDRKYEYQSFINTQNNYMELKEIDADGEIKNNIS